jgi:uracil-DNA glycosylase family 4
MTVKKRPIRRKINVRKGSIKTDLPHVGNLNAPIYLIVDPVVGNVNATKPLDKNQMEWFVAHLTSSAGFAREDVCIISCAPPVTGDTWGLGKLINAHLKDHRDELLTLLEDYRPKFIIPLGAKACQQVIGRAVQITKVRGQPIQEPGIAHGIPMLPMFSPFFAHRSPENEATFRADMQTAGRIFRSGFDLDASALVYKHNYRWCYDLTELIKKRPRVLSVDIEGVGLQAFNPDTTLLTVQICYAEGETLVVPIDYDRGKYRHHNFIPWDTIDRPKILRDLKKLLEDPRIEITGQNFKFDWLYLWYKLGITVANYKHDTMLLAHLYDENQRINIDDLVRQHVPAMAGFNDALNLDPEHHGKSRMDLLTPEKMRIYAGGDPDATWRVRDVLLEKVGADKELFQTYDKVTMPAQRAFCYIELNGFAVSREQLVKFERMLKLVQKQERIWLLKQIPKSIKDKHRDTGVGVKVTRAVILIDWLYEHEDGMQLKPVKWTKTKLPSISSKDALPHYIADYPVIARLIDYIKNDKLLNTYAKGFHKYIFDELLRPSYKLAATVTGRSASADPNGQNFPKRGKLAKEFRKFFKAPKGWVYMSCDLSQAELRIAAMMSGDPTMLKVYADGGDIHRTTAAGTMGISLEDFLKLPDEVQSLKRFQAKAVNFGFLYGMWWVKFREYAKTDYGIDFTEAEAKEIRENFFRTYPMLEHWHRDVQEIVLDNGMIRTFDGRIRHLPNVFSPDESLRKMAQRQAINSPVQAIASDLGLMSLGRLMPYIREKGYDAWLKPCGFIHDAIVCLVREDKVAEGCQLVKHFMENNPLEEWFNWSPEIPILADAEIGRTLAETYELKPSQFMDKKRSYTDLLAEEVTSLRGKLAKVTDEKQRAKLLQSIAHVEEDILLSDPLPFIPKAKPRTLNKTRSNTNAARSNPTQATETSFRVRRPKGIRQKGKQRRKSNEDATA